MKLRLARVVLSVCLAASTLIPMSAYAAAMRGIRTGVTPERTRVVFDLDGVVSYEIFSLRAPDRIVIDFTSARVDPALSYHLVGSDVLQRVRYAARGAEGLRVVLDVSRPVSAKDLSLGPAGGYGHRVVVDLSPAAPASLAPAAPATSTGTLVVPSAGGINESETAPRMADTTSGVDGSMQTAPHTAMVPVAVDAPTPMPTASTAPVDDRSSYIGLAAGDAIRDVSLDVSGSIGIESRYFFQSPRFASQPRATGSMSFKPELYWLWDEDRQSLLFVPFARVDQNDDRRTHWDIRELGYIYAADNWELRAGIRKVFWGVAESNHLVDIINQTDLVENIDLEDKLGQPMVNLALVRDWGTLDFFVLPGFRERTFPGRDGRFQGPLRILGTDAEFESAAENSHVDYALRYWNYFGVFDIGLYHFWGTTREPRFGFKVTPSGEPVLFPIYDLIHQTGADVQATIDNWLLKLEVLRRQGQDETFVALVGGFEYTFVGVFETVMDVGAIAEFHWDERGKRAITPFNDDLFVGSRLAFNDAADSQLLGGMMADLNGGGYFLNVEASRRFGDYWKVELEARWLLEVARRDPLYAFNRDDLVQLEILRYF